MKKLLPLILIMAFWINAVQSQITNYDSLLTRFNYLKGEYFQYSYDEFEKVGTYKHNAYEMITPAATLVCKVSTDGTLYLLSCYLGKDWLFHNQVIVKIGENIYRTPIDENATHKVISDGVLEICNFYSIDIQKIVRAIAKARDGDVSIRLQGKRISDVVLRPREILAIRDSYELFSLQKILKAAHKI